MSMKIGIYHCPQGLTMVNDGHKCKPAVKVSSMTLKQATRWLDNFLEARGFK